jgi:hypothetical protein
MKIWNILEDSNTYRLFEFVDRSREMEILYANGRGKRLAGSWDPIKVRLYNGPETDEESKPLGDFTGFIGPAISLRASTILEPYIANTVELLPLNTYIGPYFLLNVDWVDCLDVSHSIVRRFRTGRIMDVESYSFRWEKLDNIHIFHIPELAMSKLFVSDVFKKIVEDNNLGGLAFYPVTENAID